MENVYNILKERGFVQQTTHEQEIIDLLGSESVSFYIGFDPTADSLTVGHFMTVMAMAHMQRAGHRPIVLVGGGTGMVGDPTDKTELRRMMTREEVEHNVNCFKGQLSKFIDFDNDKAIMLDNAKWLLNLNYVDFIRTYGVHFSVNRMLTADAYRTRFEKGLTFFEFNYMLMQSYDFLELFRTENCKLQLGGNDQWSNIIGGVELIRRVEGANSYGMTFTLLTTSDGKKMGKSQAGAVWLDPAKTTPYEFFQYWRNTSDDVVEKCLALLTFLPMEEVRRLGALEGSEINKAKEVLAYEITKMVHSVEEADNALNASRALFTDGLLAGSIPTTTIDVNELTKECMSVIDLLVKTGVVTSKSEARRAIEQGGVKLNNEKVLDFNLVITVDSFKDNELMLQKGKKIFQKVILG